MAEAALWVKGAEGQRSADDGRVGAARERARVLEEEALARHLAQGLIARCESRPAAAAWQGGVADGAAHLAVEAAGHALLCATKLGREVDLRVAAATATHDDPDIAAAHGERLQEVRSVTECILILQFFAVRFEV